MVTHSSTLARKMPWIEEPGRPRAHGVAESWTRPKPLRTHVSIIIIIVAGLSLTSCVILSKSFNICDLFLFL